MTTVRTYNSVVLVKQVPDTQNISGDVMKEDGTINRSALPAIFNPEDLNALEMALQVRERFGGQITVVTMGPAMASEVLREALYRGADKVVLLSDRRFAGADTLATSYTLKCAIDGDTAQVGPQTAEKLGIPQITYAESIVNLEGNAIVVERAFPFAKEWVKCSLPCLLTVVSSANRPRPPSARKRIEYKLAATSLEIKSLLSRWPEYETEEKLEAFLSARNLKVPMWTADDIGADLDKLGLGGSPTQVHKVNYVVLETMESKQVPANPEGIAALMQELVKEYIVG